MRNNSNSRDSFPNFAENVDMAEEIFSHETTQLLLKILVYAITPCIAAFGIVGNVLSILVLRQHGLQKSFNILLVSLASSDICFLVGFNNIPKMLYGIQGGGRFLYSRKVSHFLYVIFFIQTVLDYGFGFLSLTLPVFITVERFIAVYLPLKMNSIVTPGRTWSAIIVVATYSLVLMVYTCFWNRFDYAFDPELNRSVGLMITTDLFHRDKNFRSFFDEFTFVIQPVFTLVGCVLIIAKVKMASIKRQKMSLSANPSRSSASRTTQTLMAVCVVYLFTCGVMALPTVLPENLLLMSLTSHKRTNFSVVLYQIINIVMCINSAWNFVIYIALNKNFRTTLKQMLGGHKRKLSTK